MAGMHIANGERIRKIYTVEFDFDEVEIHIIDEGANTAAAVWAFHEDLIVNAFDDIVFIRQWNEEFNRFDVIDISPSQWEELICALDSPEGAFRAIKKGDPKISQFGSKGGG